MASGLVHALLALLAMTLSVGCEARAAEVVVREPVLVAQPASLAQGPGDVVVAAPPPPPVAPPAPIVPPPPAPAPAGPAYNTEEEANFFYADLQPYGVWITVAGYGPCWRPANCPPGWRPYTLGRWAYTVDAGWLWISDEPFGWCCYHYGRWVFVEASGGWCWVPGRDWGAAWVVWRSGGGYIGWAAMPATPMGVAVNISIQISEPPAFCFSFVQEKFILNEHISTHIEPVTRNVTFISITKNITKYETVNGHVVNHGLDIREVERVIGRPVPRRALADVADPRSVGIRGNLANVFRPRLPARPPAAERVESHFVAAPPREEPAAAFDARRQAILDYHQKLLADMEARHELERRADPLGRSREQVLAHQEAERRAFQEQRRRELEALPLHSETLRHKKLSA